MPSGCLWVCFLDVRIWRLIPSMQMSIKSVPVIGSAVNHLLLCRCSASMLPNTTCIVAGSVNEHPICCELCPCGARPSSGDEFRNFHPHLGLDYRYIGTFFPQRGICRSRTGLVCMYTRNRRLPLVMSRPLFLAAYLDHSQRFEQNKHGHESCRRFPR